MNGQPRSGAPMSAEQAALVLTDAAAVLKALDSDEGYVHYRRPEIRIYGPEYEAMPPEQQAWYDRGFQEPDGSVTDAEGTPLQEYVLKPDAPVKDVFLVDAFYRVGNSMGQGGATIIDAGFNPFAEKPA